VAAGPRRGWEEQWRYLAGTSVARVEVLPGGEAFALLHSEAGERGHSLVLLDAEAGELKGGARIGRRFADGDEIHSSRSGILHRSGNEMGSYDPDWGDRVKPLTDEAGWTVTGDELCPGAATADDGQVTGTAHGFAFSVRCTGAGSCGLGSRGRPRLRDHPGGCRSDEVAHGR
jgi:hypothetical protein